jgi:hypothetical protein
MEHYTILIVRYNNACRVLPAHQYVRSGDEITFRTFGTAATILIPNGHLFQKGERFVEIAAGEQVELAVGKPGSGVYPYSVFCDATNDFAVGDSSPDLILY